MDPPPRTALADGPDLQPRRRAVIPVPTDEEMERYLSGAYLYGDDFSPEQLVTWFSDEKEACAELGYSERAVDEYAYHALNQRQAFRHLPPERSYRHLLGLGSAYGPELEPLFPRVERITIVEASDQLSAARPGPPPVSYTGAQANGNIALDDNACDLVVCLGVLHHIANVSHVLSEVGRVTEPGGTFIVREPIVSMQDWRTPRPGLTRRERGIPLPLLRTMVLKAGFTIEHSSLCLHPLTSVGGQLMRRMFGLSILNHTLPVALDAALCRLQRGTPRYHGTSLLERLRPGAACLVCRRTETT